MQCQPYSEEKRLDFWVEKVDLLHYFWEIDLEKIDFFDLAPPLIGNIWDIREIETLESMTSGKSC